MSETRSEPYDTINRLVVELAAANADRARLREMLRSLHAITEPFAMAVPWVIGLSVQKLRDTVREAGELLADVPATRVRRIDPPWRP